MKKTIRLALGLAFGVGIGVVLGLTLLAVPGEAAPGEESTEPFAVADVSVEADGRVANDTIEAFDGKATFEHLKGLVGEWEGMWEPGSEPTTVTYSLTGNGSVLVEDYMVGETTMSTVYHLDGDALMLTHYCSGGNQPRMKAVPESTAERIQFDFLDVTNHPRDDEGGEGGYSERLVLSLLDEDRVSVAYTGSSSGRTSGVELRRVR